MNQILFNATKNSVNPSNKPEEDPVHTTDAFKIPSQGTKTNRNKTKLKIVANLFPISISFKQKSSKLFFSALFVLSLFLICFSLFSYGFYIYDIQKSSKRSEQLSQAVRISSIYAKDEPLPLSSFGTNPDKMIGTIEIQKLAISYPIFSYTNDDFLKIAPCRFYGPMPNEVGNLCIAGHNYDNNTFFSKINRLKPTDEIGISGLDGKKQVYLVSSVYEVPAWDTSSVSQDTANQKVVTLITCNNKNGNRMIVKAVQP